jgi:hypothetical protein
MEILSIGFVAFINCSIIVICVASLCINVPIGQAFNDNNIWRGYEKFANDVIFHISRASGSTDQNRGSSKGAVQLSHLTIVFPELFSPVNNIAISYQNYLYRHM